MPSWFDAEVEALARRTRDRRGREALVVFYGSSTFTLWHDLDAHFPRHEVVNHGFGGATLADCLEYFDRLVTPMRPCVLIVYAGDNDLEQGTTPETLRDMVLALIALKRRALGAVPMAYVSIKVSPARAHFMHRIAYSNRIIEGALAAERDVDFLDITRRMVGRGMAAWQRCYADDPLHMSPHGYHIWGKSLSEYLERLEPRAGPLAVRATTAAPAWAVAADGCGRGPGGDGRLDWLPDSG